MFTGHVSFSFAPYTSYATTCRGRTMCFLHATSSPTLNVLKEYCMLEMVTTTSAKETINSVPEQELQFQFWRCSPPSVRQTWPLVTVFLLSTSLLLTTRQRSKHCFFMIYTHHGSATQTRKTLCVLVSQVSCWFRIVTHRIEPPPPPVHFQSLCGERKYGPSQPSTVGVLQIIDGRRSHA